jgi:hypothetical protein
MAMDFLPIQASAVPCERVFSSSAETDTKKQNHIGPTLMEVLQMLKYLLKKKRLNFMQGWTMSLHVLLQDEPDEPEPNAHPFPCNADSTSIDHVIALVDKEEHNSVNEKIVLF